MSKKNVIMFLLLCILCIIPNSLSAAALSNNSIKLCAFGEIGDIQKELNDGSLNVKDREPEEGATPLIIAAAFNPNENVISLLLEHGADVNEKSYSGHDALAFCAMLNDNPKIIPILVNAGININQKYSNSNNKTALMLAAEKNENPDIIRMLAQCGAEVNANLGDLGCAALLLASASNKNPDVIRALAEVGVFVNAYVYREMTGAYFFAARYNTNPQIIQALHEIGAQTGACRYKTPDGRIDLDVTPLMVAAMYNPNPEVIKVLSELRITFNHYSWVGRSGEPWSALDYAACYSKNPAVLKELLKIYNPIMKGRGKTSSRKTSTKELAYSNPYIRNTPEFVELFDKEEISPPK